MELEKEGFIWDECSWKWELRYKELLEFSSTNVKKVIGIGRKLRGRRRDGSTFSIYLKNAIYFDIICGSYFTN